MRRRRGGGPTQRPRPLTCGLCRAVDAKARSTWRSSMRAMDRWGSDRSGNPAGNTFVERKKADAGLTPARLRSIQKRSRRPPVSTTLF